MTNSYNYCGGIITTTYKDENYVTTIEYDDILAISKKRHAAYHITFSELQSFNAVTKEIFDHWLADNTQMTEKSILDINFLELVFPCFRNGTKLNQFFAKNQQNIQHKELCWLFTSYYLLDDFMNNHSNDAIKTGTKLQISTKNTDINEILGLYFKHNINNQNNQTNYNENSFSKNDTLAQNNFDIRYNYISNDSNDSYIQKSGEIHLFSQHDNTPYIHSSEYINCTHNVTNNSKQICNFTHFSENELNFIKWLKEIFIKKVTKINQVSDLNTINSIRQNLGNYFIDLVGKDFSLLKICINAVIKNFLKTTNIKYNSIGVEIVQILANNKRKITILDSHQNKKQIKSSEEFDSNTSKWYSKRYKLFSLFDRGITMDRTGWYECTEEGVSIMLSYCLKYIFANSEEMYFFNKDGKHRYPTTIAGVGSGLGGDLIHFALAFKIPCVAIDYEWKNKLLINNAKVYNADKYITCYNGTIQEYIKTLNPYEIYTKILYGTKNHENLLISSRTTIGFSHDCAIVSPPWGGEEYKTKLEWKITDYKSSLEMVVNTIDISIVTIVLLPYNTDTRNLLKAIRKHANYCPYFVNAIAIGTYTNSRRYNVLAYVFTRTHPIYITTNRLITRPCLISKTLTKFETKSMLRKRVKYTAMLDCTEWFRYKLIVYLNENKQLSSLFKNLLYLVYSYNDILMLLELIKYSKKSKAPGPLFFRIMKAVWPIDYYILNKIRNKKYFYLGTIYLKEATLHTAGASKLKIDNTFAITLQNNTDVYPLNRNRRLY